MNAETHRGAHAVGGSDARKRVLLLSLQPFAKATRARKAAVEYAKVADVTFVSLSAVGRTGVTGGSGTFHDQGIHVVQIPVGEIQGDPTMGSHVRNVTRSYGPALLRMARAARSVKADIVHSTATPLFPLGWVCSRGKNQMWVADVTERPAAKPVEGSLSVAVAAIEPVLLWLARRSGATTLAVCAGHADILRERFGIEDPVVVRNSPLAGWVAEDGGSPAHRPEIRTCIISSIFEGRGFEQAIGAVARARSEGVPVTLAIYGPGRAAYVDSLRELADSLGAGAIVTFNPPVDSERVSATYREHDIAFVLYEPTNEANDSLSNKMLEAVASGVPVIAGDLSENQRFLADTGAGWTVPVTVDALASALSRLDRQDYLAKRQAAELAGPTLTWEQEFAPVLGRVLQGQEGGPDGV